MLSYLVYCFGIKAGKSCGSRYLMNASGAYLGARPHLEMVKFLIANGAKVDNSKSSNGETFLHRAAELRIPADIVKIWIENGMDVHSRTNAGNTPLNYVCTHGDAAIIRLEIVKILIEKGADLNTIGYNGNTPLHSAAYINHVEIVKYLVSKGADKRILNLDGDTAVDIARDKKHREVVSALTGSQ